QKTTHCTIPDKTYESTRSAYLWLGPARRGQAARLTERKRCSGRRPRRATDRRLHARGDSERNDLALDDGERREGLPPHRRTDKARVCTRNGGQLLGVQRTDAWADDRSGRRGPCPVLRDEQTARANQRALARRASAERDGRGCRAHPAAHRAG